MLSSTPRAMALCEMRCCQSFRPVEGSMLTTKASRSWATTPTTTSPIAVGWLMGCSSVLRQASERPDGADEAIGMIGAWLRADSRLDAHPTMRRTTAQATTALTSTLFMDTPLADDARAEQAP